MPDQPIDIAIMLDDPELVRLVASWPKLTEDQRANTESIGGIVDILPHKLAPTIERARVHNLIKDDGSINEFARKYIEALVASRLKKMKLK